MPTNEEVVRAMIEHGEEAERMLGLYWQRCGLFDREHLERTFAPEFELYRKVAHLNALAAQAKEAGHEPRSVA